jgi:Predicted membrane protein
MNQKNKKNLLISVAAIAVITAGFFAVKAVLPPKQAESTPSAGQTASETVSQTASQATTTNQAASDLVIQKSSVTSTPSFYPYESNGTKMEVIAVKASDGTIRTAFNTCQVCYSSGRGYYKLEGNALVCQNCGNRFTADQVEQQKGGCNPVGITKEYKTETDGTITLKKSFFDQTRQIFANWGK